MKRKCSLALLCSLVMGCTAGKTTTGPAHAIPPSNVAAVEPTPTSTPAPAAAHLISIVGTVEIRRARELVWNKATQGESLGNNDGVRTAEGSTARLTFSDGSVLELGPKTSTIVMDRSKSAEKDSSVVAVPVGEVHAQVRQSEQELEMTVRTPRAWLRTSNRAKNGSAAEGRFTASMSADGKLKVISVKGATEIMTERGVTALNPGDSAESGSQPTSTETTTAVFEKLPSSTFTVTPGTYKAPKHLAAVIKKTEHFKILYPKNETVVSEEAINVRGEMGAGLKVFLNGQEIQADSQGKFTKDVSLVKGSNILTFQIVESSSQKVDYETIEVTREK